MLKDIPSITAMLCITALAIIALLKGVDGVFLAGALVVLSGLGGYSSKCTKDARTSKPQALPQPKIDKGDVP